MAITNKPKDLPPVKFRKNYKDNRFGQMSKDQHMAIKHKEAETEAEVEAYRQKVIERKAKEEKEEVQKSEVPKGEEKPEEEKPASAIAGKKKKPRSDK